MSRLDHLWAGWRSSYIADMTAAGPEGEECVFCAVPKLDDTEAMILERTEHSYTVMNAYPYTSGHVMAVAVRHVGGLVDLSPDEAAALMHATQRATAAIGSAYRPDGINVGVNLGSGAGAGIPGHVHMHVLPRWSGDTNFMTSVAETRVLPEPLRQSFEKLLGGWPS